MVNRYFSIFPFLIILLLFTKLSIYYLFFVKGQSPQKTVPPVCLEESLPLVVTDSQPVAHNYVDCTESNDEEDDEEAEGKGDTKLRKEEVNSAIKEGEKSKETVKNGQKENSSSTPPKWDDFFTMETLPDSQNSLNSQSGSLPSPSLSRMTGSQTPELFSNEEESPNNDANFNLTLSASLSNHSSQNQDADLADTLIIQPETTRLEQGDSRAITVSQGKKSDNQNLLSELEELSESQASSDFDIPSTPESKMPRPDELLQLYRNLAAGEDVVVRKCLR